MVMKNSKDLSWLSAPAFFLIIGMLVFNSKKQNTHPRPMEKSKPELVAPIQKTS
jgi:hypothetical protein